jgi:hypothetical protein
MPSTTEPHPACPLGETREMGQHLSPAAREVVARTVFVLHETRGAELTYPSREHARGEAGYTSGDRPVRKRIVPQLPEHPERPPLAEDVEQRRLGTRVHLTLSRHESRLVVHLNPMHT